MSIRRPLHQRPLSEVPDAILRRLATISLDPSVLLAISGALPGPGNGGQKGILVRASVTAARRSERAAAALELALNGALGGLQPLPGAVGCLGTLLRTAVASRDLRLVARILWHTVRRSGLAWRRLEERVDAALEAMARNASERALDGTVSAIPCACGSLRVRLDRTTLHLDPCTALALERAVHAGLAELKARRTPEIQSLRLLPPPEREDNAAK